MDKRFRPLCLPKTFVPSETLVPVPGLSGEVFNSLNEEQIVIEHRRLHYQHGQAPFIAVFQVAGTETIIFCLRRRRGAYKSDLDQPINS